MILDTLSKMLLVLEGLYSYVLLNAEVDIFKWPEKKLSSRLTISFPLEISV